MNNLQKYLTAETYIIENGLYDNCKTKFEAAKVLLPKEAAGISRKERFAIWESIQSEKRLDVLRKINSITTGKTPSTPTKDYERIILDIQDAEGNF